VWGRQGNRRGLEERWDAQVPPGVSAGLPPPNWYPDPQDPSRSRYWDGTRWTEHTHSLVAPTVAATYQPLLTPARTLFFMFAVTLVLTVIALLSDWAELSLLGRILEDPASVSPAEANASDQRQGVIGLLQLLLYLGTVVAFLVWFRRAYSTCPPWVPSRCDSPAAGRSEPGSCPS
jgi:hypothetical protein